MMNDLTVVYFTANFIPLSWEKFVTETLLKSIGDLPLISVSQKPMDFGFNICVGDIGRSHLNIYRQMLIGAKATETEYIAFVEDDVLLPLEHFIFRPSAPDVAAYNMNKWALFTWMRPPTFNMYPLHHSNAGCIIARNMFIEAMEERFAKYPVDADVPLKYWAEVGRYEGCMHITQRKLESFYPSVPHIFVSHETALGFLHLGKRKRPGELRVTEVPPWGTAEELLKHYYGEDIP